MPNLALSNSEVRRGYHSGLSGHAHVVDPARGFLDEPPAERTIVYQTFKYISDRYRIVLRTERDGWNVDHAGERDEANHQLVYKLPTDQFAGKFNINFILRDLWVDKDQLYWNVTGDKEIFDRDWDVRFSEGGVWFGHKLEFATSLWKPGHLITLRTSVDGGRRDLFGVFSGDRWTFLLDIHFYPNEFDAHFVLDREMRMNEQDVRLSRNTFYYFKNDADVTFSTAPSFYSHGYDNFTSLESRTEQLLVRSPGRESDDFEVIVIGSGMGGGTLADALSDRGVRVLLLEAGGLNLPVHMNELPRTEMSLVGRDEIGHANRSPHTGFSNGGVHFNLGGRSVYWSGLIPRMEDWEFRPVWPAVVKSYLLDPVDGKSGYDHADRLMRKQKTLGRYQGQVMELFEQTLSHSYTFEDLPRSMHQPDIDDEGEIQNVIERSTGGFSTADLLLDSLGFADAPGRAYLRVNLHHLVKRIETEDGHATSVVCQDLLNQTERRYSAPYVVLSCGSVESPKLVMASGIQNRNGKIGKGFTDHPAYFYTKLHPLPTTGENRWLGDSRGHAKIMLRRKHAGPGCHPYNIELLIGAKYWDTRHADDDVWAKRLGTESAAEVEIKFIFDSRLDDNNQIHYRGDGAKVEIHVERNEAGTAFKDNIVAARNEILGALGVIGLTDHYDPNEWSEGVYGSVHHAGGSLRMSDDGTGVVDENLKFLDYDNLYCCDVSVFPSIPAANPSLTVVALAQRLAVHLKTKVTEARSGQGANSDVG